MFQEFINNIKDIASDTLEKAKKHPVAAAAFAVGGISFADGTIGLTKDVVAMFKARKLAEENEAKAAEAAEVYDPETTAEATQG